MKQTAAIALKPDPSPLSPLNPLSELSLHSDRRLGPNDLKRM